MPSPSQVPVKAIPAPQAAAASPPVPQTIHPLASTSEKSEMIQPKPAVKAPPPKLKLLHPPVQQVVENIARDTDAEAAAIPLSGLKADTETVLEAPAASARPAGPPPDYISLIRAKLEKAKRYPSQARFSGQEGIVTLRFALDRSGQLLNWRVEKGAGVESLDDEAGEMVQRASPFPPFPPSIERERLELVVPIEFSLKTP